METDWSQIFSPDAYEDKYIRWLVKRKINIFFKKPTIFLSLRNMKLL